jgi:ribosomal protein S18 acetylase RimI-like enzyme
MLTVRAATASDAVELARVAAVTFPLACPPSSTEIRQADHIARWLSRERFAEYAADPGRLVLLAEVDGEAAGYTMLVFGEPDDADVLASLRITPTAELSKCYVMPDHHGQGVASALMDASLAAARTRGVAGIWLGVNNENARAQRFYAKSGFEKVGSKRFLMGDTYEDDFVMERSL